MNFEINSSNVVGEYVISRDTYGNCLKIHIFMIENNDIRLIG